MQGITITLTADDKLTNLLERFVTAIEQGRPTQVPSVNESEEEDDGAILETPKTDDPKIQEAYESIIESEKELEKTEKKKEKSLSLTEVRKVVIETGLSKHPNQLSSALNKFGACKLSEIKKDDYQAFVDYVKEIKL